MTLEILQSEMIAAMKAKNKERKDVIAGLISAIKKAGIDANCRDNIPEDMVNTVLIKEQKTMQEMIDTCPAERVETLAMYHKRMKIVNEFAPSLMTDPMVIEAFIKQIAETANVVIDKKNRGIFMKHLKGKADMKIANSVIEKMF